MVRFNNVTLLIDGFLNFKRREYHSDGYPHRGESHEATRANSATKSKGCDTRVLHVGVQLTVFQETLRLESERIRVHFFVVQHSVNVANDDGALGQAVAVVHIIGSQTMRNRNWCHWSPTHNLFHESSDKVANLDR